MRRVMTALAKCTVPVPVPVENTIPVPVENTIPVAHPAASHFSEVAAANSQSSSYTASHSFPIL
jgi:hypothetical protein